MFIGSAERKLAKPEWISPDTERHHAFAFGSSGSSELLCDSWRYSPMARVSQITRSPWRSRGTKKDGERRRSSARTSGSWLSTTSTVKSSPANLHNNHPRSDHAP